MQIKFATISQSLFRKYLMLLVTLLSVVLIATAAINIYSSFRANKEALLGLQINEALSASEKIGQFITEVVRQIQLTTEKIQLIKEVQQSAGSEEVSSEFFRLLRQVPAVTRVSYLDSSGREQLRVSRLDLDVIGSQQDLSEDPKFVEAKSRGIYFGPVYFREESEPYIIIAVAGSDADTGVTVAELNLKLIWDVVSRIEIGKAGYAYVVDPQGTLVAHPNISLVLRKTNYSSLLQFRAAQASRTKPVQGETVTIAENLEGRQVLTAYATVPPLDWLVFVELPTAEAYAPLYALIWRSGLLLLGGLALAFLASLFLARRMVVPIQALRAGAARIGSGDLTSRIAIKTGDELEALADQFNRMAAQLQDSYAGLERKVEERTHQLELANLAKSRFLAAASHDLRQPLQALGMFVEQLHGHMKSAEGGRLVKRIDAAVAAMNELFNALLDISRLDAGVLSTAIADFPVAQVLTRIESTFAEAAREKGLSFQLVSSSAWVRSDPILLERIVLNLVSNAGIADISSASRSATAARAFRRISAVTFSANSIGWPERTVREG